MIHNRKHTSKNCKWKSKSKQLRSLFHLWKQKTERWSFLFIVEKIKLKKMQCFVLCLFIKVKNMIKFGNSFCSVVSQNLISEKLDQILCSNQRENRVIIWSFVFSETIIWHSIARELEMWRIYFSKLTFLSHISV